MFGKNNVARSTSTDVLCEAMMQQKCSVWPRRLFCLASLLRRHSGGMFVVHQPGVLLTGISVSEGPEQKRSLRSTIP